MSDIRNQTQRVNLFLDPEIVRRGKAYALNTGKSLSEVVDEAVDKLAPKIVMVGDESRKMGVEFVSEKQMDKILQKRRPARSKKYLY